MAYIKIDQEAFFYNLDTIAEEIGTKDKIALVLKDNAYGHGLLLMAQLASTYGISKAVVRSEDEARLIDDLFGYILILDGVATTTQSNFYYAINSMEQLKQIDPSANIEIKIDSGMHRNGIEMDELNESFFIAKERGLNLHAIFTHFRSADELTSELFWQYKNFEAIKKRSLDLNREYLFGTLKFHSSNSAALFRLPDHQDMVRVGIAAYGLLDTTNSSKTLLMKPVLSLHAKRISTRVLQSGQRVGYGGRYEAKKEQVVSSYDAGYADGLPRSLYVACYTTPDALMLLGTVSMDSCMLATKADEVCLFDDAREVAKALNTISYEIVVNLSRDLHRLVSQTFSLNT